MVNFYSITRSDLGNLHHTTLVPNSVGNGSLYPTIGPLVIGTPVYWSKG